jgi:hypothetical protein
VWFRPVAGEPPRARFARLGVLARDLGSRKVVWVREGGSIRLRNERGPHPYSDPGALREDGQISVLNLRTDLEPLLAEANSARPTRGPGAHRHPARRGVEASARTVSVTSPFTLLRELFTVKGSGTLVKAGSDIRRYGSYAEIDVARLRSLLERAFGRRLAPGFFARRPLALYLEASYQGGGHRGALSRRLLPDQVRRGAGRARGGARPRPVAGAHPRTPGPVLARGAAQTRWLLVTSSSATG